MERHLASRADCAQVLEGNFSAAIAAGQLPADTDPKHATLGLFSFIDGLIYNWLLDPDQFLLAQAAPRSVETYLCGLSCAVGK